MQLALAEWNDVRAPKGTTHHSETLRLCLYALDYRKFSQQPLIHRPRPIQRLNMLTWSPKFTHPLRSSRENNSSLLPGHVALTRE